MKIKKIYTSNSITLCYVLLNLILLLLICFILSLTFCLKNELTQDLSPNVRSLVETIATKDGWLQRQISRKFLIQLTLDVQSNIHRLLNLRDCVVSQMLQDRLVSSFFLLKYSCYVFLQIL